jgi:hypothetical protein
LSGDGKDTVDAGLSERKKSSKLGTKTIVTGATFDGWPIIQTGSS